MDINKLRELVAFMRSEGVQYMKTADVELMLSVKPSMPLPLPSNGLSDKPDDKPLPDYFKRLNPNYSNPMLFPESR